MNMIRQALEQIKRGRLRGDHIVPHPSGEWVRFDDVSAALGSLTLATPSAHDAECETELTSHGYTPCRCDERAALAALPSGSIPEHEKERCPARCGLLRCVDPVGHAGLHTCYNAATGELQAFKGAPLASLPAGETCADCGHARTAHYGNDRCRSGCECSGFVASTPAEPSPAPCMWREVKLGVIEFHPQAALRERFYHVVDDLRAAGCIVDLWLMDIATVLKEFGYEMTVKAPLVLPPAQETAE